jgi:hypothetical protein
MKNKVINNKFQAINNNTKKNMLLLIFSSDLS